MIRVQVTEEKMGDPVDRHAGFEKSPHRTDACIEKDDGVIHLHEDGRCTPLQRWNTGSRSEYGHAQIPHR